MIGCNKWDSCGWTVKELIQPSQIVKTRSTHYHRCVLADKKFIAGYT